MEATTLPIGTYVRVQLVRETGPLYDGIISEARHVFDLLEPMSRTWDRERFLTLMLDSRNKLTGLCEVSVGTLAASLVHPREVFKAAILGNAASIIIAHNHPSGDPKPSLEDQRITKRLQDGAELLGIPVLDHVIVGAGRYNALTTNKEDWPSV